MSLDNAAICHELLEQGTVCGVHVGDRVEDLDGLGLEVSRQRRHVAIHHTTDLVLQVGVGDGFILYFGFYFSRLVGDSQVADGLSKASTLESVRRLSHRFPIIGDDIDTSDEGYIVLRNRSRNSEIFFVPTLERLFVSGRS